MTIRRTFVAVLVGGVLLAACGGGGSADGGDRPSPTSQAPAASPVAPAETPEATGDGGSGPSVACVEFYSRWIQATAGLTPGSQEPTDLRPFFEQMAKAAPEEIRADVELFGRAYARFITALQEAGFESGQMPTPEQLAALEEASKILEDPAVQAAGDRITEWFERECGQ